MEQAYYQALAAQAVQKVAQVTLDLRRVTLRQVSALAESALDVERRKRVIAALERYAPPARLRKVERLLAA